jgi:signal peptidase II
MEYRFAFSNLVWRGRVCSLRWKNLFFLLLCSVLVFVDQVTKKWVVGHRETLATDGFAIPKVIHTVYAENSGAAFGILQNARWLFVCIGVIAMVVLGYIIVKRIFPQFFPNLMLTIVLAGALGNFIDRALQGYVVDFLELLFIRFAIFNLADIFITWAGVLFVIYWMICQHRTPSGDHDSATDSTTPA